MRAVMDIRSRINAERGFALIEVIVSAAVLALVALAVLSGIDGATSAAGREKARSVAAALAEKDQERLRSMPVEQLASYAAPASPIVVDGATYNVDSKVEWVRDSTGGTISCANDNKQADYLHITSTVTSNIVGSRTKPVRIDSIVAPNIEYSTTHGSLAVKVVNAAGQGVPGVGVSLAGASSPLPQSTNEQGCALFQMIAVGDYIVTLSGSGMVNHAGDPAAKAPATVSAGLLTTVTMDYDFAGVVNATFETYKPGSTTVTNNTMTSVSTRMSAVNGDDLSILRKIPATGPAAPAVTGMQMTNLFPFSASYSFFTGGCRYSNPTNDSANSGYFGTYPGAIAVTPSSILPVTVRQPPLNIRLSKDRGGGNAANTMRVVATPIQAVGDSCVEPSIELNTFTSNSLTGVVGRSQPANNGPVEVGVPFGYYKICFQRGTTTKRTTVWPDDYLPDARSVLIAGTTTWAYDNTDALGKATRVDLDATATGKWHDNTTCLVTNAS